jgi:hypothetical protein
MKSANPPRLAAWILEHFGPELNQEALAGDLNEAMAQGRSNAWYWRQVMAAVRWRRELLRLLVLTGISWYLSLPHSSGPAPGVSRSLDVAIFVAGFLLFGRLPGLLRGRTRAVLAVAIVAFFCLLFRYNYDLARHYQTLGTLVVFGLIFHRNKRPAPPYHLTLRELVYGDPNAERQRLMEKLHLAVLHETDPEVRQAYTEAIAVLQRSGPPAAQATE